MDSNGTEPACDTTGSPLWQARAAMLLMAAVVVYYVAMAGLNLAGYFDYREFAVTDTSTYRYIGRRMAEGALLYTDVWDIKGPVVYLTYYWGYLLSGGAAWGVELAILFYSLAAAFCTYRVLRCVAGPLPSAVGLALVSLSVGFIGWCGTTGESTYTLLALLGLVLILPAHGSGGEYGWRWVAAGALVGLCVLCKANYAGFGCFLLAYWGMQARAARAGRLWRPFAASAAGFAVLLGCFGLVMGGRGNLGDMLDASVLFNLQEYHSGAPGWASFPALPEPLARALTSLCAEFQYAKHFVHVFPCMAMLLGISCVVLWRRRRSPGMQPGIAIPLAVWIVAEFLTGGVKFLIYDHYYETLFLPVCLLAAHAVSTLQAADWKGAAAFLLIAVGAMATSGPWEHLHPLGSTATQALHEVDSLALKRNPRCSPIPVLGGADTICALNRLSMHSDQRYTHCQLMLDYNLSPARREELLDELSAALEQAAADGTFLLSEEPLPSLIGRHPDLAPLLQGWRPVEENGGMRVYLYLPPIGE